MVSNCICIFLYCIYILLLAVFACGLGFGKVRYKSNKIKSLVVCMYDIFMQSFCQGAQGTMYGNGQCFPIQKLVDELDWTGMVGGPQILWVFFMCNKKLYKF